MLCIWPSSFPLKDTIATSSAKTTTVHIKCFTNVLKTIFMHCNRDKTVDVLQPVRLYLTDLLKVFTVAMAFYCMIKQTLTLMHM